jgi:hypothetical protein
MPLKVFGSGKTSPASCCVTGELSSFYFACDVPSLATSRHSAELIGCN